jgi:hypothetical protein
MDAKEILGLKISSCDFDNELTVLEYLKALLTALMKEGESFSGKRPFGNSGWERDVYKPLITAGMIDGKLDEDGYIEECDDSAALKKIVEAIKSIA